MVAGRPAISNHGIFNLQLLRKYEFIIIMFLTVNII